MKRTSIEYIARLAEVRDKILDCIREGHFLAAEITSRSGLPVHSVTNNLIALEREGLIHRERVETAGQNGYYNLWTLGASDEPVRTRNTNKGKGWNYAGERKVTILKEYPANPVRDPLVAALFGAPKQSAPVCTACKVEQGKGHLSGCVVALVAA